MKSIKTIKTLSIMLFFAVAMATTSCKKEDKTPIIYGEENPLNGFLSQLFYLQETYNWVNEPSGIAQLGMSFKPLVNGKINALVVKIPSTNNNLKIIIWDKATKAKLRVETMNITTSNTTTTKEITPLVLTKNKEYVITMFSDDYYARNKTDNTVGEFPITSGNFQMTGSITGNGDTELYPLGGSGNQYFGDCSFNFQRTE